MPEVIKIGDCNDLVPTSKYPFAKWEYDMFNPVQSRLMETYEGNSNIAIAAATSAGKTVAAEMYLAYELRKRGGKGIYVGPLKALAKEKEQDWTGDAHHFHGEKTAIITGDYRLTEKRVKEIDESGLIVMTPEMLASRCRNHKSEKSTFLQNVGTIVFDESHLLTVPSRGDHIEVALMKMADINPNVRFVLLSATMPNVDEICGWVSKITNRDTYYLESEYRPCPLNIHYETYFDGDKGYEEKELYKVGTACGIVEYYPDDKFLIFVHTKNTGRLMIKHLERYGEKAEFHNADLSLKDRLKLEDRFKNGDLRVIVATSTLAWGLNLPARRVIVTGIHRGLERVPNYDIQQEIGRAGRPKYDAVGDAYILVPESTKKETIAELRKKSLIKSVLLEYVGTEENPHYKTLAFHVVSEIHRGNVKTREAFHDWFRQSLAYYQEGKFDDQIIDKTIELLVRFKAIKVEDEIYQCTSIGTIASMFYYSPFDVSDLRRNFHFLFEKNQSENDFAASMAMGNIDTWRFGIVNRYEREQMAGYEVKVKKMFGDNAFTSSAIKMGFAYYNMLKGLHNMPAFQHIQTGLLVDLDRTMQVVNAIDSMSSRWGKRDYFRTLKMRFRYGVEPELVELCQIPNVGHVRANRLKDRKIKTIDDFVSCGAKALANYMKVSEKAAQQAIDDAKNIQLQESISGD